MCVVRELVLDERDAVVVVHVAGVVHPLGGAGGVRQRWPLTHLTQQHHISVIFTFNSSYYW